MNSDSNANGEFDGTHTLTNADLEAIRKTIFEKAPIDFMDTQKVVLENKELKADVARLKGWVALLTDSIRERCGVSPKDTDHKR